MLRALRTISNRGCCARGDDAAIDREVALINNIPGLLRPENGTVWLGQCRHARTSVALEREYRDRAVGLTFGFRMTTVPRHWFPEDRWCAIVPGEVGKALAGFRAFYAAKYKGRILVNSLDNSSAEIDVGGGKIVRCNGAEAAALLVLGCDRSMDLAELAAGLNTTPTAAYMIARHVLRIDRDVVLGLRGDHPAEPPQPPDPVRIPVMCLMPICVTLVKRNGRIGVEELWWEVHRCVDVSRLTRQIFDAAVGRIVETEMVKWAGGSKRVLEWLLNRQINTRKNPPISVCSLQSVHKENAESSSGRRRT